MRASGRPPPSLLHVLAIALVVALGACDQIPLPAGCGRSSEEDAEPAPIQRRAIIAVGATHTCAVLSSGHLSCWGGNMTATLGDGTLTSRSVPVELQGLDGVVAVGAGDQSTCAVLGGGGLQCWGLPLTDGAEHFVDRPSPVEGVAGAVAVSVAMGHGCALLRSGHVACFGDNGESQLGSGGATTRGPVEVPGIEGAISVSAGDRATCVVSTDGLVRCWGNNDYGQLGDGSTRRRREPGLVQGVQDAVDVAVSRDHACVLQRDGSVWCWGRNDHGQLGAPVESSVGWPRQVEGLAEVTSVAAGNGFTCVSLRDGSVRCFGLDPGASPGGGEGGPVQADYRPRQVAGISDALAVAAGAGQACAALRSGGVRCWGNNLLGQLGDGAPIVRTTATPVVGVTTAAALSTNRDHNCVALRSGEVSCWGRVWPRGFGSTPTAVGGITGATSVAAGGFHGCAVTAEGTLRCWGGNAHGQLGDGTTEDRRSPITVTGLTKVAAVAAGEQHTCAVSEEGRVSCWGRNDDGQLGDGTRGMRSIPMLVEGLPAMASVAAASSQASSDAQGSGRTCAISKGGGRATLTCWGSETWADVPDRFAELLVGGEADAAVEEGEPSMDGGPEAGPGELAVEEPPLEAPEPIVYGRSGGVTAVALSVCHACLVTVDGAVTCWDGSPQPPLPPPLEGISDATDVAVSGNACITGVGPYETGHVCAVLGGGGVVCWGRNGLGQLGDGTTEDRASPVQVRGVSDAVAIEAGVFHSCALIRDGSVRCWGYDSWGQLGSGRLLASSAPVGVCSSGVWDGQGCAGGALLSGVVSGDDALSAR